MMPTEAQRGQPVHDHKNNPRKPTLKTWNNYIFIVHIKLLEGCSLLGLYKALMSCMGFLHDSLDHV